jgi:hypothetical protein
MTGNSHIERGLSRHAATRAQQRGIPPMVDDWLTLFGEEIYDGNGAIIVFFSRDSVRQLERQFGREPVRRMSEYLDCYKVMSSRDATVISIGHRYKRMNRR